ncbi:MAG: hypothetical protein HC861_11910, partial [Rhodospirillaceae bacterium]|nr:hypothetical protein [Rhodospirillaceae bacterium]
MLARQGKQVDQQAEQQLDRGIGKTGAAPAELLEKERRQRQHTVLAKAAEQRQRGDVLAGA